MAVTLWVMGALFALFLISFFWVEGQVEMEHKRRSDWKKTCREFHASVRAVPHESDRNWLTQHWDLATNPNPDYDWPVPWRVVD